MYSAVVQEHFHQPRRVGPLAGATHTGTAGVVGEGPYLVLWLRVDESHRIQEAAYQTFGCPAAIASGSMLAELVEGKSVSEALLLSEESIVESLGGLPEGKDHCPRLAVHALKKALSTFLEEK
ncbi:MAG: iron-sulfur cluster assembly scaffold protein [Armatimonas sp.]